MAEEPQIIHDSDSEEEENESSIWARNGEYKRFTHLEEPARDIILQCILSDKKHFPHEAIKTFGETLRKTLKVTYVPSTKVFIWKNVIRWTWVMKQSLQGSPDTDQAERLYFYMTDILAQYVNYMCETSFEKDDKEIENVTNEIYTKLAILFHPKIFYIVMTLLKVDVEDNYRKILDPIFKKCLFNKDLSKFNDLIKYLGLVLCFRRYKKLFKTKEEKEEINKVAAGKSLKQLRAENVVISSELMSDGILPKFVPKIDKSNQCFTTISGLIKFAADKRNVGTRILLINESLDLDETICKYFEQYELHLNRNVEFASWLRPGVYVSDRLKTLGDDQPSTTIDLTQPSNERQPNRDKLNDKNINVKESSSSSSSKRRDASSMNSQNNLNLSTNGRDRNSQSNSSIRTSQNSNSNNRCVLSLELSINVQGDVGVITSNSNGRSYEISHVGNSCNCHQCNPNNWHDYPNQYIGSNQGYSQYMDSNQGYPPHTYSNCDNQNNGLVNNNNKNFNTNNNSNVSQYSGYEFVELVNSDDENTPLYSKEPLTLINNNKSTPTTNFNSSLQTTENLDYTKNIQKQGNKSDTATELSNSQSQLSTPINPIDLSRPIEKNMLNQENRIEKPLIQAKPIALLMNDSELGGRDKLINRDETIALQTTTTTSINDCSFKQAKTAQKQQEATFGNDRVDILAKKRDEIIILEDDSRDQFCNQTNYDSVKTFTEENLVIADENIVNKNVQEDPLLKTSKDKDNEQLLTQTEQNEQLIEAAELRNLKEKLEQSFKNGRRNLNKDEKSDCVNKIIEKWRVHTHEEDFSQENVRIDSVLSNKHDSKQDTKNNEEHNSLQMKFIEPRQANIVTGDESRQIESNSSNKKADINNAGDNTAIVEAHKKNSFNQIPASIEKQEEKFHKSHDGHETESNVSAQMEIKIAPSENKNKDKHQNIESTISSDNTRLNTNVEKWNENKAVNKNNSHLQTNEICSIDQIVTTSSNVKKCGNETSLQNAFSDKVSNSKSNKGVIVSQHTKLFEEKKEKGEEREEAKTAEQQGAGKSTIEETKEIKKTFEEKKEVNKNIIEVSKEANKNIVVETKEPEKSINEAKKEPRKRTIEETKEESNKILEETKETNKSITEEQTVTSKNAIQGVKESRMSLTEEEKGVRKGIADDRESANKTISAEKASEKTIEEIQLGQVTKEISKKTSEEKKLNKNIIEVWKEANKNIVVETKEPKKSINEAKKEPRKSIIEGTVEDRKKTLKETKEINKNITEEQNVTSKNENQGAEESKMSIIEEKKGGRIGVINERQSANKNITEEKASDKKIEEIQEGQGTKERSKNTFEENEEVNKNIAEVWKEAKKNIVVETKEPKKIINEAKNEPRKDIMEGTVEDSNKTKDTNKNITEEQKVTSKHAIQGAAESKISLVEEKKGARKGVTDKKESANKNITEDKKIEEIQGGQGTKERSKNTFEENEEVNKNIVEVWKEAKKNIVVETKEPKKIINEPRKDIMEGTVEESNKTKDTNKNITEEQKVTSKHAIQGAAESKISLIGEKKGARKGVTDKRESANKNIIEKKVSKKTIEEIQERQVTKENNKKPFEEKEAVNKNVIEVWKEANKNIVVETKKSKKIINEAKKDLRKSIIEGTVEGSNNTFEETKETNKNITEEQKDTSKNAIQGTKKSRNNLIEETQESGMCLIEEKKGARKEITYERKSANKNVTEEKASEKTIEEIPEGQETKEMSMKTLEEQEGVNKSIIEARKEANRNIIVETTKKITNEAKKERKRTTIEITKEESNKTLEETKKTNKNITEEQMHASKNAIKGGKKSKKNVIEAMKESKMSLIEVKKAARKDITHERTFANKNVTEDKASEKTIEEIPEGQERKEISKKTLEEKEGVNKSIIEARKEANRNIIVETTKKITNEAKKEPKRSTFEITKEESNKTLEETKETNMKITEEQKDASKKEIQGAKKLRKNLIEETKGTRKEKMIEEIQPGQGTKEISKKTFEEEEVNKNIVEVCKEANRNTIVETTNDSVNEAKKELKRSIIEETEEEINKILEQTRETNKNITKEQKDANKNAIQGKNELKNLKKEMKESKLSLIEEKKETRKSITDKRKSTNQSITEECEKAGENTIEEIQVGQESIIENKAPEKSITEENKEANKTRIEERKGTSKNQIEERKDSKQNIIEETKNASKNIIKERKTAKRSITPKREENKNTNEERKEVCKTTIEQTKHTKRNIIEEKEEASLVEANKTEDRPNLDENIALKENIKVKKSCNKKIDEKTKAILKYKYNKIKKEAVKICEEKRLELAKTNRKSEENDSMPKEVRIIDDCKTSKVRKETSVMTDKIVTGRKEGDVNIAAGKDVQVDMTKNENCNGNSVVPTVVADESKEKNVLGNEITINECEKACSNTQNEMVSENKNSVKSNMSDKIIDGKDLNRTPSCKKLTELSANLKGPNKHYEYDLNKPELDAQANINEKQKEGLLIAENSKGTNLDSTVKTKDKYQKAFSSKKCSTEQQLNKTSSINLMEPSESNSSVEYTTIIKDNLHHEIDAEPKTNKKKAHQKIENEKVSLSKNYSETIVKNKNNKLNLTKKSSIEKSKIILPNQKDEIEFVKAYIDRDYKKEKLSHKAKSVTFVLEPKEILPGERSIKTPLKNKCEDVNKEDTTSTKLHRDNVRDINEIEDNPPSELKSILCTKDRLRENKWKDTQEHGFASNSATQVNEKSDVKTAQKENFDDNVMKIENELRKTDKDLSKTNKDCSKEIKLTNQLSSNIANKKNKSVTSNIVDKTTDDEESTNLFLAQIDDALNEREENISASTTTKEDELKQPSQKTESVNQVSYLKDLGLTEQTKGRRKKPKTTKKGVCINEVLKPNNFDIDTNKISALDLLASVAGGEVSSVIETESKPAGKNVYTNARRSTKRKRSYLNQPPQRFTRNTVTAAEKQLLEFYSKQALYIDNPVRKRKLKLANEFFIEETNVDSSPEKKRNSSSKRRRNSDETSYKHVTGDDDELDKHLESFKESVNKRTKNKIQGSSPATKSDNECEKIIKKELIVIIKKSEENTISKKAELNITNYNIQNGKTDNLVKASPKVIDNESTTEVNKDDKKDSQPTLKFTFKNINSNNVIIVNKKDLNSLEKAEETVSNTTVNQSNTRGRITRKKSTLETEEKKIVTQTSDRELFGDENDEDDCEENMKINEDNISDNKKNGKKSEKRIQFRFDQILRKSRNKHGKQQKTISSTKHFPANCLGESENLNEKIMNTNEINPATDVEKEIINECDEKLANTKIKNIKCVKRLQFDELPDKEELINKAFKDDSNTTKFDDKSQSSKIDGKLEPICDSTKPTPNTILDSNRVQQTSKPISIQQKNSDVKTSPIYNTTPQHLKLEENKVIKRLAPQPEISTVFSPPKPIVQPPKKRRLSLFTESQYDDVLGTINKCNIYTNPPPILHEKVIVEQAVNKIKQDIVQKTTEVKLSVKSPCLSLIPYEGGLSQNKTKMTKKPLDVIVSELKHKRSSEFITCTNNISLCKSKAKTETEKDDLIVEFDSQGNFQPVVQMYPTNQTTENVKSISNELEHKMAPDNYTIYHVLKRRRIQSTSSDVQPKKLDKTTDEQVEKTKELKTNCIDQEVLNKSDNVSMSIKCNREEPDSTIYNTILDSDTIKPIDMSLNSSLNFIQQTDQTKSIQLEGKVIIAKSPLAFNLENSTITTENTILQENSERVQFKNELQNDVLESSPHKDYFSSNVKDLVGMVPHSNVSNETRNLITENKSSTDDDTILLKPDSLELQKCTLVEFGSRPSTFTKSDKKVVDNKNQVTDDEINKLRDAISEISKRSETTPENQLKLQENVISVTAKANTETTNIASINGSVKTIADATTSKQPKNCTILKSHEVDNADMKEVDTTITKKIPIEINSNENILDSTHSFENLSVIPPPANNDANVNSSTNVEVTSTLINDNDINIHSSRTSMKVTSSLINVHNNDIELNPNKFKATPSLSNDLHIDLVSSTVELTTPQSNYFNLDEATGSEIVDKIVAEKINDLPKTDDHQIISSQSLTFSQSMPENLLSGDDDENYIFDNFSIPADPTADPASQLDLDLDKMKSGKHVSDEQKIPKIRKYADRLSHVICTDDLEDPQSKRFKPTPKLDSIQLDDCAYLDTSVSSTIPSPNQNKSNSNIISTTPQYDHDTLINDLSLSIFDDHAYLENDLLDINAMAGVGVNDNHESSDQLNSRDLLISGQICDDIPDIYPDNKNGTAPITTVESADSSSKQNSPLNDFISYAFNDYNQPLIIDSFDREEIVVSTPLSENVLRK